MQLKALGRTGIKLPEIGIGTWKYRGGAEPLRAAIGADAFHVDTAEAYGTEGAVGDALRDLRDKVFMATKVSPSHFKNKDVINACQGSLKQLGISTIDLYQLHWPSSTVPLSETMWAMEELADAGKIRFIGVSNFPHPADGGGAITP